MNLIILVLSVGISANYASCMLGLSNIGMMLALSIFVVFFITMPLLLTELINTPTPLFVREYHNELNKLKGAELPFFRLLFFISVTIISFIGVPLFSAMVMENLVVLMGGNVCVAVFTPLQALMLLGVLLITSIFTFFAFFAFLKQL